MCKHSTAYIVARLLRRQGEVSAHSAVYSGLTCPSDGALRRDTRLADAIHELRHEHGWEIATERGGKTADGKRQLARYVLKGEGMTPASSRAGG